MTVKVAILSTVAGFGGSERVVQSIMNSVNKNVVELVGVFFTRPGKEQEKFFKGLRRENQTIHKISLKKSRLKYYYLFLYRLFT